MLPTVDTDGVNCILYTAVKAAGNVTDPDDEFTVVLPHCNSNPFGKRLYPGFAIDDAPKVNVFVANVADCDTVKLLLTTALFVTCKLPDVLTLPVTETTPVTATLLLNVAGVLTTADDVLIVKTFNDEFARIQSVFDELTTTAGPDVFPVVNVKFVIPSLVLTVVVVNDDIR